LLSPALSFSLSIFSLALPRGNEKIPSSPMGFAGFADGELEKKTLDSAKTRRD
jgi:hypothetical protein